MKNEALASSPGDAWATLEAGLARALASLGGKEWQYLILSDQRTWWYVQFAAQAESALRAEAVSNEFLAAGHLLSEGQMAALAALGWTPPEAQRAKGDAPAELNYCAEFERPVDFDRVATLAVRTLREVLQVPSPDHLRYAAFERAGRNIVVPGLEVLEREGPDQKTASPSVDAIRSEVLGAIRKASGNPGLELDKDKDIEVRYGSAVLYVRVHEKPPYVSIFSPVLRGVPPSEDLVRRLDELNRQVRFARVFELEGAIYAACEVFAKPLVLEHVVHACRTMGEFVDDIDEGLQAQFGGRTAFGPALPAPELKN